MRSEGSQGERGKSFKSGARVTPRPRDTDKSLHDREMIGKAAGHARVPYSNEYVDRFDARLDINTSSSFPTALARCETG